MIFRRILTKVFQRRQTALQFLHLIHYYESLAGQNLNARYGTHREEYALYVIVGSEKVAHQGIVVTIYVCHIFVFTPAEFLQDIRLAHLPRTKQDKRFTVGAVLPGNKVVHYKSFHSSANVLINQCKDTDFQQENKA